MLTVKEDEAGMIDKERLIKAWGIFQKSNPYEICEGREFRAIKEPEYCMGQMISDTIAILKEQPEVVRCKDCVNWIPGRITENDDFVQPRCKRNGGGWSANEFCSDAEKAVRRSGT